MGRGFPEGQSASEEKLCRVELFSVSVTYHDPFHLLYINNKLK